MSDPSHDPHPSSALMAAIKVGIEELATILKVPCALDFTEVLLSGRRDYRAFWVNARTVGELFKQGHLPRDDRQRLWSRFNELRDAARRLEDGERESRESESLRTREAALSLIREARNWIRGGGCGADLQQGRLRLTKAIDLMKEGLLLRTHRDECWQEWKEVGSEFELRREQLSTSEYDSLRSEIGAIASEATYGDPYEAIKQIKALQQNIRSAEITRDQLQWLRESLQPYWDKAQARIDERRQERSRQQGQWRERKEAKKERLRALIAKNEGVIDRLKSQIDDLEDKIRDAWNDDWAERAREWVREKYAKIEDIERTNASLEETIVEVRDSLDD